MYASITYVHVTLLAFTFRQGMSSPAVKNLDVEFAIMARDIKLPEGAGDGSGVGLEAAAAQFGAQRMAAQAAEEKKEPLGRNTSHSYGVDPVTPGNFGETREQREEDVRNQQRQLEEEGDDDEDEGGLC